MPTAKPAVGSSMGTSAGSTVRKSEVDLDSPYRMSAHGQSSGTALAELEVKLQGETKQLTQTQKKLEDTRKRLEETRENLRKAEAEKVEMRREHDVERENLQSQMSSERSASEERLRSHYDAKFQGLDKAAYNRARKDLLGEMDADIAAAKASRNSAELKQKSSAKAADLWTAAQVQAQESLRRQEAEHAFELARAKTQMEFKTQQRLHADMQETEARRDAMFEEELRTIRDGGEVRRREREGYDDYRELWMELNKAVGFAFSQLEPLQGLSKAKLDFWLKARDNFKPERIEAWFPQRYTKLTERFRSFIGNKLEAAMQSNTTLESHRNHLPEVSSGVRASAHYARIMTRHHHFEVDYTATQSIALCREMLNEVPLTLRTNKLDQELREVNRQIGLTSPGKRREQLDLNRAAVRRELVMITGMHAFYKRERKAATLKQVSQSSRKIQEIFMRSLPAEEAFAEADLAWAAYQREKGNKVDDDSRYERDNFTNERTSLHTLRANFERSITRRHLLEDSIGEPAAQNGQKSYSNQLARLQSEAESSARAKLREVISTKRATSATISSRPVLMPSRVASPVQGEGYVDPNLTSDKLERRGRELKASIASATSSAERKDLKEQLSRHQAQFTQWQIPRSESRRRQAAERKPKVATSESAGEGEQSDETRQDSSDVNASALSGSGAKSKASNATGKSKRGSRRLRTRNRHVSPRSQPVTDSSESVASTSGPGPALKPTQAKQAPRVYWPDIPLRTFAGTSTRSRFTAMSITSQRAASSDMNNFDAAEEAAEALEQWQLCSSRSSWSSYAPSEQSESTGGPASPGSANDGANDNHCLDLPHLAHHMSKEDHRNAVMASPNTTAAYWTYKLYKNGDEKSPPVYYCTNLEQAELRAKEFLEDRVIGFDIEWEIGHAPGKSGIKKNVSLIQIAADDKIALFHVALFKGNTVEELMPPSLRQILESSDVVKAGVNIQGDASRMKTCLNVQMTGIFELSHLYKVVTFSDTPDLINRRPFKLADQVQDVLLLPLKKDAVRTSAWSKRLDMQQTEYAASDAYAGFRLYHALEAKRKLMDPMPPRPAFWEEHKPIQLGDGTLIRARTRKRSPSKKVTEAEEEEEEEFFDAVETLDACSLAAEPLKSAGVPLAGMTVTYPTLPTIEDDLGQSMSGLTISDATSEQPPPQDKPTKRPAPPQSEQVSQAEQWVKQWRASLPVEHTVKATAPQLRAYALWHEQGLKCKEIAVLLRETPLALQTVATYVLEAVRHENLEFDHENAREALGILPSSVHRRYGRIVDEVGK